MELLQKIAVPTVNLKVECIQELLILVKDSLNSDLTQDFIAKVLNLLWNHLEQCLENLDDQLLCATCFYSVLTIAGKTEQDCYMEQLLLVIGSEINSPLQYTSRSLPGSKRLPFGIEKCSDGENEITQSKSTLRVISLIYGMFQSSFLTKKMEENISNISVILTEIINLLLPMGYEYSEYTFLVFKIINNFKKLCGGPLEKYIYSTENNLKLLNLVNDNWENPITGVRDFNRSIFKTIISTLDKATFKTISMDIEDFYWNKAKFLMLSDIIERHSNIMLLINHKWIDGLVYSLRKPGLVSAGADMYYALLKNINNEKDWCKLFLVPVLNILSGNCNKAIENFCNYWCLTTIKKFRTISHVLIDELEKLDDSEQCLYGTLCILKQATKLGVLENNWSLASNKIPSYVMNEIDHYNAQLRILAFEIVCISKRKSTPSLMEYNFIFNYLRYNLNSDSTVLRINMFSSFNYFLSQLHSTFLKECAKTANSEAVENLLNFCMRVQGLVESNIIVNGNYQRKITSIKLCNSLLSSFSSASKKKRGHILSSQNNVNLINFLKQKDCWLLSTDGFINKLIALLNDPADDVRENVTKVLLSHFTKELQNETILKEILNNAEKCIQSKFFYEISCGQSMFRLITNLLINNKEDFQIRFKSVEAIFEFAFNELLNQHAAKANVMNSIEKGQQLHSYINIMLVVLEECIANDYTLTLFDHSKMSTLLHVLESVSNQFVLDVEGSSDFSEINDMIQNIILTSDYNSLSKDDETKISGLQQIVLNCLWLNVKASCDLAAILIRYNVNDDSMCERSLHIITRVLETSRHKGAIEAAGTALGRGIKYLTSLPEKKTNSTADVSKLPYSLLKCKLNDLISETNKMSSVTRRGAGLSIMLHRIVSNDMKIGKPLFHYFMKTLLQKCKHSDVTTSVFMTSMLQSDIARPDENKENQLDLAEAIYIHFMTKIVTDSSLATDVMYYSAELAELAFGNLTSSHWQIRNAALQLYGALIPRLIGQKKASGTGDETIATVACDEMRTHSPELWKYITNQLKQNEGEDLVQTHSNLVPILNMLASIAKRYHFSLSIMTPDIEMMDLFNHLMVLLGSPIYTVRRLSAKAIFNIYEFEYISDSMLKQENMTENLLHGMLLLLNFCYNYFYSNTLHKTSFEKLKEKFQTILTSGQHSYLCRNLYENSYVVNIDIEDIESTILELKHSISPGIQVWAENRFQKYIHQCSWTDIPNLLNLLLPISNDDTLIFEFLLSKIEKDVIVSADDLLKIANILTAFERKYCSGVIWKALYEISKRTNLDLCIETEELLKNLKSQLFNLRYIVPLIARHIEYASDLDKHTLLNIINELSDFEKSDVDMRYIAGIANNELSQKLHKLPDSLKVISIKCAVLLLQDEDEDVRNLSVHFYCIISGEKRLLQPYICLSKILERCFLHSVLSEPQDSIKELKGQLSAILQLNHEVDEYNPFANESKNIYFEPHVFKVMVDNLDV